MILIVTRRVYDTALLNMRTSVNVSYPVSVGSIMYRKKIPHDDR